MAKTKTAKKATPKKKPAAKKATPKKKAEPKTPHEGRNLQPPPEKPQDAQKPEETAPQAATEAKAAPEPEAPVRLTWALNGANWEAKSLKVSGRLYTVSYVPDHGHLGGYPGQKKICPAAGVYHPLASYARKACQDVEDSIE